MAVDVTGPAMAALLDCANTALNGYDRPVARAFLNPGLDTPWDACADNCDGQLWVRVIERFPSGTPFPSRDTSAKSCHPLAWATTLAVGVLRCTPTVNDDGSPPAADAMTASALEMTEDAAILEEALRCCFAETAGSQLVARLILGAWVPLGPQGGCVGGEWQLTIASPVCACPTPDGE